MPAKFKPSERVVNKVRGQRMNTASSKNKKYQNYWLKNTAKQELFDAINSSRTKPKHKQKFRNELVRRGIKIEWLTQEEFDNAQ
jgi:hypothetical protein|tara:strand:- start:157 stop:408 length:252 start_codon:yes stop_codon:yes gene_type:complete